MKVLPRLVLCGFLAFCVNSKWYTCEAMSSQEECLVLESNEKICLTLDEIEKQQIEREQQGLGVNSFVVKVRQKYKELLNAFYINACIYLRTLSLSSYSNHQFAPIVIFDVDDTALLSYKSLNCLYPGFDKSEAQIYLPAIPQVLDLYSLVMTNGINICFITGRTQREYGVDDTVVVMDDLEIAGYFMVSSVDMIPFGVGIEARVRAMEFTKDTSEQIWYLREQISSWKKTKRDALKECGYEVVACFDDQEENLECDETGAFKQGYFKVPTINDACREVLKEQQPQKQ